MRFISFIELKSVSMALNFRQSFLKIIVLSIKIEQEIELNWFEPNRFTLYSNINR